jgi:hypothetical protein
MKIRQQTFALGLISAAIATLAACGGGGGDTSVTTPVATTAVTTTVMDGLIQNALVCVDTNSNGICDVGETQGRTDASGKVTLAVPTALLATAKLVARVGTDAIDADIAGNVKVPYTMSAPAGKHTLISPLTTQAHDQIELDLKSGKTTTAEAAELAVKALRGLSNIKIYEDDYVAGRANSDLKKASDSASEWVKGLQAAKTSAAISGVARCKWSDDDKGDDEQEHAVERDLRTKLLESGDYKTGVSCATTPATPPVVTPPITPPPVVTPPVVTPPVAPPVVTPPVVAAPVVVVSTGTQTLACAPGQTGSIAQQRTVTTTNGVPSYGAWSTTSNACVTPAPAPVVTSAANGKLLYNMAFNGQSCASCHSPVPAYNVSKVLKGANSASAIQSAIDGDKGGMGILKGAINSQQLTDIAAYLATPNI